MKSNPYKEFGISSWAINNSMTTYVIIAIILFMGFFAYFSMPREAFPEVVMTQIYVSSINPGNAAEDVEKFITEPLEKEFNNVAGVKKITSTTLQDFSIIIVEFEDHVEIANAKQLVKDRVDMVKAETTWPTLDNGAKVEPTVFDMNISEEFPILNINLTGDFTPRQLKLYAEHLQDEIELLGPIKEATIRGIDEEEVEVALDLYKMSAAKVSFDNVINAIRNENKTISGGHIKSSEIEKNLRIVGEIGTPEELNDIVVKHDDGVVFLRDIAAINFQQKETTTLAREDGKPVVMLDVKKRAGRNMLDAVDQIKATLAYEQANYFPADLEISISNDQSVQTENQVDDLVNNIIFGVLLVVLVLMFFLGFKNALFVGFAIPMSMLMALAILSFMGFTLNTMVLFGLVMGLGMLVDNGIVVVENAYSLMQKGMPRMEAVKQGMGEVAWPIIASTATTLAAFFPLGLWPGVLGNFLIFFPITLSVVLGSSLFVALIINAMLISKYMQVEEKESPTRQNIKWTLILGFIGGISLLLGFTMDSQGFRALGNIAILAVILLWLYVFVLSKAIDFFQNTLLLKLDNAYERSLKFALAGKRYYLFIFGTIGIFMISIIMFGLSKPKVELFPDNEPNQIITYIEFPEGTAIEKTNKLTLELEEKIKAVTDKYLTKEGENYMVESFISQVGKGSNNPMTEGGITNDMPHRAKITLSLYEFQERRGKRSNDLMNDIREVVRGNPGVSVIVEKDMVGPPVGYPINIEIVGDNYDNMLEDAENIRTLITSEGIAGIENLLIDVNKAKPEYKVTIDRQVAGQLGIPAALVGQTLRRAIYGEEASTYKIDDKDYEINVRLDKQSRYNEDRLLNQPITFQNNKGQIIQVPISAISNIEQTSSFSAIKRRDLKRVINIHSNVLAGYNANEVLANIAKSLEKYSFSDGVSYKFTGEQEEQEDNMTFLLFALFVAVGGILLILVGQFNSISKPIIIVTSILLSLSGVFIGMLITDMNFIIIMTMMGIISLAGIVVNNAIILIDYTLILIARYRLDRGVTNEEYLSPGEYRHLIIMAGKSRLRPVLLTAITTILGLIPLAIGLNIDFFGLVTNYNPNIYMGGDNVIFWGPLAWTVIFGLSIATFLTLIVVPLLFYVVERGKVRRAQRKKLRLRQAKI